MELMYSIRKIFLLQFFVITATFSLNAQRILTLEEAIATALENNYDIRISRNDSLSAALDYQYRDAVFLPTLNGFTQHIWNNSTQKQVLIDTTRKSKVKNNNIQANVALSWTLFDGLKMFTSRDKAKSLLEAGSLAVKTQIVNTVADVVRTYYNIARQKQQIHATDVQIGLNSDRVKLAQAKLDIGVGAKPDVLLSRTDLNLQEGLKVENEANIDILKQQLVQAMNDRSGIEFDVPDTIPVNYQIALADVLSDLDAVNPGLQLARKNIEVAEYTLKETRGDLYPTINFVSNYNFNRSENSVAINRFSPLFNQTNGFNYGFTANIPIFNQFRVRKQIKHDQLNINFQKLNYDNQRSLVTLNILNAFKSYEQQKKQLKLAEENMTYSQELLFIENEKYRLGRGTLIEVRQAQAALALTYDRLIAARYNAKLSEIELMRLRGDILK